MLRTIRILLALLSFMAVTALFVDVTGYAAAHWAWMAKIQFVPALLSLQLLIVLALVVLTFVFGRIYCSVICPLGIYQDIVARISITCGLRKTRKLGKYHYHQANTKLRIGFLAVFSALLIAGQITAVCTWCASLIEPYSAFGRMATWLLRPLALLTNNWAADIAAAHDSYAFAHHIPMSVSIPLLVVASVTFLTVTAFAWTTGRGWCNEICPVGTVLGFISRYSWLRPVIDKEKCKGCNSCARKCKSSCIDIKGGKTIDYSRCVACMDCMGTCSQDAIRYTRVKSSAPSAPQSYPDKEGRRAFLAGGTMLAGSLAASALGGGGDGGFAPLQKKQKPRRATPLTPPGARSNRHLAANCTACQLCISNCPNGVLSPSTDLSTWMQPVMDYSAGYCRPECTVCSDVCPAGAILPIDEATKSSTKIGTAEVDLDVCISARGRRCGKCSTICPAGAIEMIPVEEGSRKLRPLIDPEACIGCGSCEYHCPAGTVASLGSDRAAIHVEGVEAHRII